MATRLTWDNAPLLGETWDNISVGDVSSQLLKRSKDGPRIVPAFLFWSPLSNGNTVLRECCPQACSLVFGCIPLGQESVLEVRCQEFGDSLQLSHWYFWNRVGWDVIVMLQNSTPSQTETCYYFLPVFIFWHLILWFHQVGIYVGEISVRIEEFCLE